VAKHAVVLIDQRGRLRLGLHGGSDQHKRGTCEAAATEYGIHGARSCAKE
jgi:hypothetical protein